MASKTPLQCFQKPVVEVGKLGGDPQPLAPVGGGLKEAIGLNQGQKLSLHHGPVLLLERRLGDIVAVRRLMSKLDGLPQ